MREAMTDGIASGRRTGLRARVALAGMLSLLAPATLRAQPQVELDVQTDTPYVNEPLRVELRVSGFKECEPPAPPALPDATLTFVGTSSGTSVYTDSRGQFVSRKHQTFIYQLTVHRPGVLTIPEIPVVVDGTTLKTRPQRLTVRDLPQSPPPRPDAGAPAADSAADLLLAEITCAQSKLYVGQHAEFTLTIWIKPARVGNQPLDRANMVQLVNGNFGPFDAEKARAGETRRQNADGTSTLYYVVTLPAAFTLTQPGPLTFDDVYVGINYPLRFGRDFFGDLRITEHRALRVRPTISVPDVRPLPTEGRPANFSGAVGQYELKAFAVPTNVRVGDPIQLVIDVRGAQLETVPAPDLTAIPELVENFRVPSETLAGTISGDHKRFTQVIRPRHTNARWIPPIEFAYFDPQAEQYVVARSDPIPLLVKAVEQLEAAELGDITADAARRPASTLEARDGLRGNKMREAELLASSPPVSMTQVALVSFVPPAAFLGCWGLTALARRRRDVAATRRRHALRNAERRIAAARAGRLSSDRFHSELQAALAGYLADRLNQPPACFLGRSAIAFLQERAVDPQVLQQCAELLQRCEEAAYAAKGDRDHSLADLARDCVRRLEREPL